jgi:hypothetical protein
MASVLTPYPSAFGTRAEGQRDNWWGFRLCCELVELPNLPVNSQNTFLQRGFLRLEGELDNPMKQLRVLFLTMVGKLYGIYSKILNFSKKSIDFRGKL